MSSTKSRKEVLTDKLYYPIRIAILLSVVFLFIPNLNPARICGMINKKYVAVHIGYFLFNLNGGVRPRLQEGLGG